MSAGQPSLQWRLVLRLSFLQAIFLILLAVLIVAALWATGSFISLQPEDETIDAISQSVGRSQNGALVLKEPPALAARREDEIYHWPIRRSAVRSTASDRPVLAATSAEVSCLPPGCNGYRLRPARYRS